MNKLWESLLTSFKRERLLFISTILVMTVTFVVLGLFLTISTGVQTALEALENQAQVTVFFKDDFPEANVLSLESTLEKDERVLSVEYVSKEEAFKIFSELNKDEPILLEAISANILPASLEIKTKNIEDLSVFANELSSVDGVEEVKYFEDVVARFRYWRDVTVIVGLSLTFIFAVISFSIVAATLRMIISSKGTEISILKLVGAADSYVKKPLIFQGVFFGTVSSVLASMLLLLYFPLFIMFIAKSILGSSEAGALLLYIFPEFSVGPLAFRVLIILVLILSGITLGYLGSLTAVKKHLKY